MDALYQKQILSFAKHSRSQEFNSTAMRTASMDNPTCGDRVDISFDVTNGVIKNIGVRVRGCALCEAGAGLLLRSFDNISPQTAHNLADGFADWMAKNSETIPHPEMEKFMPVREIRNRHKCVLLAFNAAISALKSDD